MATLNSDKTPPKTDIKFSVTLSEEQKQAKAKIIATPFNFILGKAGSGKTLLAVQIALDMFFKRRIDKIIMTRPTVSNEDNGFIYHCGIDIMNNHLIRSNTFKTVCKENSKSHLFNTIGDSMRNVNGKVINETLYFPDGIAPKNISSHIYRVDDILSFDEA